MARPKRPASPRRPRPEAAPRSGGEASRLVTLGRVVGAFGVQGWIKVKPYTESPAALGGFGRWTLKTADGWREMALEEFEMHAKGPVARLEGCADRGAAERLRGCDIAIGREALGEAGEGWLYQVDLVGLEVRDAGGRRLGTVEGFLETGAASVMVVKDGVERLIPFVADYVKAVDREARRIVVDWKADYDA